jgi:hypothetical protein
MDTKSVATMLGTDARVLRRFLRDKRSTFTAVGSGSRYEFTETDLPELERRFRDWMSNKQPSRTPVTVVRNKVDAALEQRRKDMAVWSEEGPVFLEDLRDPRVRRRVRATAAAWDARLEERLLAVGLHISQKRYQAEAA